MRVRPPNRKSKLTSGEILLCFDENLLLGPRCRSHLLGARHRCDLLRGMAGYRLRWLHPFVVELPANVLASFPELIHALPQAPRQVRQLFRPEEDENDEEYDKKIRTTQIPNPKCKNIHYHSKLVQPMVYSRETQ